MHVLTDAQVHTHVLYVCICGGDRLARVCGRDACSACFPPAASVLGARWSLALKVYKPPSR